MLRNLYTRRLFNEAASGEGGGAGGGASGGDAPKFTQADLDRVVTERVRKLNDELKSLKGVAGEVETLKQRAAEFEAEKAKAAEEAELKGKSDLEKLQHQLKKAGESYKAYEAESAKKYAELEGKLKARESEHIGYVKKTLASEAILTGAAEGMGPYALEAFLREADIQLGEGNALVGVVYDGKPYEKPGDAAKAFFAKAPGFAKPPAGGSGGPRVPTAPGGAGPVEGTGEQLFAAGLRARAASR